ncbi:MAG TPA: hypothetical protein VH539_04945 [Gemmatimonadaceae bacterium]
MHDFDDYEPEEERAPDPQQVRAGDVLREFFKQRRDEVFSSRQVEVVHEGQFFHWVTNRAIRELEKEGLLRSEMRDLAFGGSVKLIWHRAYRYPKRYSEKLVALINEYSAPNIGGALGLHGELMVLEGFAKQQFVLWGREVNEYGGARWIESEHDLDFVFGRDGVGYGVEVKNTLPYMDYQELRTKIRLCRHLGLRPVVAARMLPKTWIEELRLSGGFALVLKYQLYPLAHADLAKRVRQEMGLPVDSPRSLAEGTMARFVAWHSKVARML